MKTLKEKPFAKSFQVEHGSTGSSAKAELHGKDDYNTPKWLMDVFDGWFDPCPNNPNFDGLIMDWKEKNYVNPPYSNPLPWVEKAIEENKKGKRVVMLLRVDTSTKWFAKLVEANAHFFFASGRLHYSDLNKPPNFASMLVVL